MDSKDFDIQQLELDRIDKFCFVVYYGSEFNLKTLSVAGKQLPYSGKFTVEIALVLKVMVFLPS